MIGFRFAAMTEIIQQFKEFEHFAYGQFLHTSFTELLDWTLLPLKGMIARPSNKQLNTYRNHRKVNKHIELVKLIGD
jgi:hypothetical protein